MPVRTNAEGLLEILHPETGAYVPASALLQVEGGWLAALVPNQVAMLSDIRSATTHLELIENVLIDVRAALATSNTEVNQSNTSNDILTQINTALITVNGAIDSLEALGGSTNSLLQSVHSKIDQLSGKLPGTLGAKIGSSSLSVALSTDSAIFESLTNLLSALSAGGNNTAYNALTTLSGKLPTALGAKLRTESLSVALATDSTVFTSLTNLLSALTDGGTNSVYSALVALSNKLPASAGAKLRAESLSVALATDSTIFASLTSLLTALTDGGANSVYSALVALSSKVPASLGAKLRTESLSVALATDSTVFTSLTNLLSALTDGGTNSVYSALVALSNKLPASAGAKLRAESLSVALATDSTIFASLTSLLTALTDGGANSVYSTLVALSNKLPPSVGGKVNASSLSVALATDSPLFAALTDGGVNSVYSTLVALSNKLPASVGGKLNAGSLSVALATDSTIFTSLANLLAALTDGGANSVYSTLVALSNKLPASVGGKLNAGSLSVALATDSTIFTSLASILSALSGGGANTAITRLTTIATAQSWTAPAKFNSSSPIISAATAAVSSAAYAINPLAEALSLQNFFSAGDLSAQFAVELRVTAGATSLSDKTYYYRGDVATPFAASTGAFPGESPITIPTYGHAQAVVHLYAISGGNVTTYAKEIK